MTSALIQKLSECKDLRRILETTVTEVGLALHSNCCQILLANPLDPNSALICEAYSQADFRTIQGQFNLPSITLPLVLNGRSFGTLILISKTPWSTEEIESTNVLVAKLSELIRQAQINDIVQRETFRVNFLAEITNLMSYSLVIGDALFMVVNILGKALRASRCLFVCTDDKTSGWKCYEFWQQDKVKSCQEYHWPTNDSSLIAQTLRARVPLKFFEGQENSYLTPAQAELQFSGTRSLLALPLVYEGNVYGCVIIQQCDYRRDWTRDEIDTVQDAADKVAKALASLPEEKRIHKPIMQLHQRTVTSDLVQSLKGAFGQKSIPSATGTTLEDLPAQNIDLRLSPKIIPAQEKPEAKTAPSATTVPTPTSPTPTSPIPVLPPPESPVIKPAKRSTSSNKLKAIKKSEVQSAENKPVESVAPNIVPVKAKDKKPSASSSSLSPSSLANPPSPSTSTSALPAWENLDDIPTPSAGPAMSGLGASMIPKVKAQPAASGSSLRASLHKSPSLTGDEANSEQEALSPIIQPPSDTPSEPTVDVSNAPVETEEEAKEKVERALAAVKEQDTKLSDYVFAISDIDQRILGRIVNWIEEIEKKDKYLSPHALAVAEYSCAIAANLNLSPRDIEDIKIAALLHDVGKLGTAADILQKRDEELDDAELLTIMRHPMDGAELLKSIPDLASFAAIVLAHHEEYNGNGYPQGLKGEEIPLAARIIFIANSYHGMTSKMRYGDGLSTQEALKQLQDGAGNQYDPAAAEAFIKYLQSTRR